jgi:hypothetical protein
MLLKDKLKEILRVCCWGWWLPLVDYQIINDKLPRNILVWGRARDTPPPLVIACNVAIFLRELVTCTTMWAYPLGNPCIKTGRVCVLYMYPGGLHSDCTNQITSCQDFFNLFLFS